MHNFIAISEFKLKLQSGNAQFASKSAIFLSCVTFKFDGWPWKTMGHLYFAVSSLVHHFTAINEFKIESQSGNSQFGSISMIFRLVWPWIWQMTLKYNRAPLILYFKLCVSSRSHYWIQTGVTVWERQIWVKNDDFFSHVTLKFDRWPWKKIWHLS